MRIICSRGRWPERLLWTLMETFTSPAPRIRRPTSHCKILFRAPSAVGVRFHLVVASQELQRTSRRLDPFIGLVLSFRYRGTGQQEIGADHISLEFATHSHVVHGALDPEAFSTEYQNNVDAFAEDNEREILKHPEKKDEKEAIVRAYEKELVQVQEFLTTRGLHSAKLDSSSPEISGWIFFRAKDKWIGGWKKKEEFVLRIPLGNRVVEFPFTL